jgi:hypothetical protein
MGWVPWRIDRCVGSAALLSPAHLTECSCRERGHMDSLTAIDERRMSQSARTYRPGARPRGAGAGAFAGQRQEPSPTASPTYARITGVTDP